MVSVRSLSLWLSHRNLILSLVGITVTLFLFFAPAWAPVAAQQAAFVTVSAASYRADAIAPESIVAGFGVNLSTATASGRDSDPNTPGVQLPTTLVGVTVRVNNVPAPLFFVSPGQINYQIPANTPLGEVAVEVTTASGAKATGTIVVSQVAPAIFTANADGTGVPSALILRVAANGAQAYENLAAYNQAANRILATPINLGPEGERVFLILYLTGMRRVPDPNNDGNLNEFTRVIINGVPSAPLFAGTAPGFIGLEQINVEIPRSLLGSAALDIQVIVNGYGVSNTTGIELVAPAITSLSFRPLGLPNRTIRAFATIGSYLFAATNQGVWCSSDSGANWINASNGLPTNADVRTFFVDGTTLYAGLGSGGGICVSTNNGQSWTALNSGLTGSTLNIYSILYFSGRLYAATQGGVCRYINGVWEAINSGLTNVDAATLLVYGGRLCVGTRGGGIFLLGSGNNWGSISNGLPSGAQVLTLAGAGAVVFAGLNGGGLCISRNGGALWTQVAGGFPANAIVNSIWADGLRIYVGTGTGVYVSSDGGAIWTLLSNGLSGCNGANNTNVVFAVASRLLTGSTGCGVYGAALAAGTTNRVPVAYEQTVSFDEDTAVIISLSGFDADLDPLTYSIVAGTARGSLNGALPNITYTPGADFTGQDRFTFRASDGRSSSNTAAINLIVNPINDPPTISSPASVTANAGAAVNFSISANDVDGDALTITTTTLPSGAIFNPTARTFSWPSAVTGNYPITFTVTDGQETRSSTTTLVVNAPVVAWTPLGTGISGIGKIWAFHLDGSTIYAGGDFGIWRSTNSGATWAAFSTGLNANAALVYRLAFINARLYAATTGGLYVLNNTATGWTKINNGLPSGTALSVAGIGTTLFVGMQGVGTYRSTDGGASFALFGSQQFGATSSAVTLFVDGDFVLAGGYGASNQGLYRSPISSANWTYINSFGLDFPASFQRVGNTLIAGGSGYLYFSTDAGASWTRSTSQAQSGQFYNFVVTTEGIYAAGTGGIVVFTNNNGATWTIINQGITSNQTIGLIRDGNRLLLGGVNAIFTRPLVISGNNPPVLTVPGAQTATVGQPLNFTVSATDPDAGQSLSFAATNLPNGATFNTNTRQFSWTPTANQTGSFTVSFTVTDNGAPALSDTETVTITVQAGSGGGPLTWTKISTGLPTGSDTRAVAVSGNTLFVTYQHTYGVYRSTNGGTSWTQFTTGLPSNNAYGIVILGDNVFVGTQNAGIYRTTLAGSSWTASSTGIPANTSVWSLYANGNALYAGAFNGQIYRSTDNGANWTSISTGLPSGANVLAQSIQANGTTLLAGYRGQGIYRSTDNGANWTQVTTGLPDSPFVIAMGQIGNVFYAGLLAERAVYRSSDGGATWTLVNNGLPTGTGGFIESLVAVGNTVYVGMLFQGVYSSSDGGANWIANRSGLPAQTVALDLTTDGSKVYLGVGANTGGGSGVYRGTPSAAAFTNANQ